MNISKFFIDRPIFAAVLSVVILLAGIIALTKLPTAEYPEVVPPSVVVRAQYPGANPKVIAETVASLSRSRSTASKTCCTCSRRPTATAT
ncbi:RND efflux system, inner membrane transporter CmeB [Caballeronia glathei]|nr:RND efflux system, inner membrane transporter CmeB [Caballeronia glathei]